MRLFKILFLILSITIGFPSSGNACRLFRTATSPFRLIRGAMSVRVSNLPRFAEGILASLDARALVAEKENVGHLLYSGQNNIRAMDLVSIYREHQNIVSEILELRRTSQEDAELAELADAEIAELEPKLARLESKMMDGLRDLIYPVQNHVIVTLNKGVNGQPVDVERLAKMYEALGDKNNWRSTRLDSDEGSITLAIEGRRVFQYLSSESGIHKLVVAGGQETTHGVRTGRQFHRHVTVGVYSEPKHSDLEIRDNDIRVDRFRAGGPGGQNVNKTESAVRVTHIPTGITAQSQATPHQARNLEIAMRVLRARVATYYEEQNRNESEISGLVQLMQTGESRVRVYRDNGDQVAITESTGERTPLSRFESGDFLDVLVNRANEKMEADAKNKVDELNLLNIPGSSSSTFGNQRG